MENRVIVLDCGLDLDGIAGPLACCAGNVGIFR